MHALIRIAVLVASCAVFANAAPSKPELSSTPKPLVAVMPLDTQGVSSQEASLIADAVASRLHASRTCNVMERSQMSQILKEQAFQQSGACDGGSCAVEIGKILSVDRILVGSVGRIGDAWALNLRLVRVETGEVIQSASGKKRGGLADAQQTLVEQVVGDLTGTRKSNAWIWWTSGGIALAGGVAAAVLLTQDESSSTPEPTTGSYKIVWSEER